MNTTQWINQYLQTNAKHHKTGTQAGKPKTLYNTGYEVIYKNKNTHHWEHIHPQKGHENIYIIDKIKNQTEAEKLATKLQQEKEGQ